jgi:RimJ/RimL family protein N-acetyltransferase
MKPPHLGPTLTTDRLILRPPKEEDFEGYVGMCGDEEVMRFIGGAQCRADAWRSLAVMAGSWGLRGYGFFTVLERESGAFVGRVGPWSPGDDWPATEVGWSLCREHWGKGYAGEAAEAAMDWTVKKLQWDEIAHTIQPENTASIKVAERLGARNLRTCVGLPGFDNQIVCHIYGQSRDEWLAKRRIVIDL